MASFAVLVKKFYFISYFSIIFVVLVNKNNFGEIFEVSAKSANIIDYICRNTFTSISFLKGRFYYRHSWNYQLICIFVLFLSRFNIIRLTFGTYIIYYDIQLKHHDDYFIVFVINILQNNLSCFFSLEQDVISNLFNDCFDFFSLES